jgi:hypothetical protein
VEITVRQYLTDRWIEEDADGVNMHIVDERRQRLQDQLAHSAGQLTPVGVDESGTASFNSVDLDNIWLRLTKAH